MAVKTVEACGDLRRSAKDVRRLRDGRPLEAAEALNLKTPTTVRAEHAAKGLAKGGREFIPKNVMNLNAINPIMDFLRRSNQFGRGSPRLADQEWGQN